MKINAKKIANVENFMYRGTFYFLKIFYFFIFLCIFVKKYYDKRRKMPNGNRKRFYL